MRLQVVVLFLACIFASAFAEPPTRQGVSGSNRCITAPCSDLITMCAGLKGQDRVACVCTEAYARTLNACNQECPQYAGPIGVNEYMDMCKGQPLARLDVFSSTASGVGKLALGTILLFVLLLL